jgi:hypothetical protein
MAIAQRTVDTAKHCPICGTVMQPASWETSIEELRMEGVLSGLELPIVAHGPGWKCPNPKCGHFEPAVETAK